MGASWFLALLLAAQPYRATLRDLTFLPAFEKANPKIKYLVELKRMKVPGDQELVVLLASPEKQSEYPNGEMWWAGGALVGAFLQDGLDLKRITTLALLTDSCDCTVRVEQAREGEVVLARTPEKGLPLEKIKLFFDAREKKLISKTSYLPFAVPAIVEQNGVIHFVAGNGRKVLVIRPAAAETGFSMLADRESWGIRLKTQILHSSTPTQEFIHVAPVEGLPVMFGPGRRFRLIRGPDDSFGPHYKVIVQGERRILLPPSRIAEALRRRPDAVRNGWRPALDTIQEGIGPHQAWNEKLWFGKTFYDSEGLGGVGGFGYFDGSTGIYTLYSPPEIWPWSVSAILVEAGEVWLGLMRRGEYGDTSGGLLHWNRATEHVKMYRLRSVARAIGRFEEALYVATEDGIAVLRPERTMMEYWTVDVTLTGTYRVVRVP